MMIRLYVFFPISHYVKKKREREREIEEKKEKRKQITTVKEHNMNRC